MTLSQHSWTSAYQKVQDIIPSSISREVAIDSLEVKTSLDNVSQKVQMLLEEPCIWDFYNIFFQNSQKFFWFDGVYDLKDYFLDLLHNDIEKAVYFMRESIQYFLNELSSLQYYRKNTFSIEYLNKTMRKLQELDDQIKIFYDFQDKSFVDNNTFAEFVLSWRIDTAYNFAVKKIKREKEVLEEVRSKILRTKIQLDFKQLPSFNNWMKKLEKLAKEFWYLQTNFN